MLLKYALRRTIKGFVGSKLHRGCSRLGLLPMTQEISNLLDLGRGQGFDLLD